MALKKEISELREQSLAMEIYQDSKRANKRICFAFTIIVTMLVIGYFTTVGLFLHYISTLGYEEEISNTKTQEITDVDTIENSSIVNGDVYGDNKTN